MNQCSDLIFLSTIACKLFQCLDEQEIAVLSADFMTLGDMLASLAARRSACRDD